MKSHNNWKSLFLQDLIAEVDIVMDAETPLWKAHDVSQALQDQLEVLPGVCRAFVHVDHDVSFSNTVDLNTLRMNLDKYTLDAFFTGRSQAGQFMLYI